MYYQYHGIIIVMKKFSDLLRKIDTFVALAIDPGEITRVQATFTPAMKALYETLKANYNIIPPSVMDQARAIASTALVEHNVNNLPEIIQAANTLANAHSLMSGNESATWKKNVSSQAAQVSSWGTQLLNALKAWKEANPNLKSV